MVFSFFYTGHILFVGVACRLQPTRHDVCRGESRKTRLGRVKLRVLINYVRGMGNHIGDVSIPPNFNPPINFGSHHHQSEKEQNWLTRVQ